MSFPSSYVPRYNPQSAMIDLRKAKHDPAVRTAQPIVDPGVSGDPTPAQFKPLLEPMERGTPSQNGLLTGDKYDMTRTTRRRLLSGHGATPRANGDRLACRVHEQLVLAGMSSRSFRLLDIRTPVPAMTSSAAKVHGITPDPYDAHRIATFGDGAVSVWRREEARGKASVVVYGD
ncbi:hypothetical protein B0H12DRAFT_1241140 [Mycena haematopus]|nr:hypothetical protein B0H12DRAFT_1241140 [Mycena haematopus]